MTSPVDGSYLNDQAYALCQTAIEHAIPWKIKSHTDANGTLIIDFGVHTSGGLQAGLTLAQICMAGASRVSLEPADDRLFPAPRLQVYTDQPIDACMASQYAGWPISGEDFFAMGSGPMRAKRGREHVLQTLAIQDPSLHAVGVLECDRLPSLGVCAQIANEAGIAPDKLVLCIAPTRSLAGTIQVVARSIETSMHKLFELGFDLRSIVCAHGVAPIPPIAIDFAKGIGRTNDAILYGGHVTLWVESEDSLIETLGPQIPSNSSKDFGQPFATIFKRYNYDFYQVDPGLFSPAIVSLINLKSGNSWRFGEFRPDVLEASFAERSA